MTQLIAFGEPLCELSTDDCSETRKVSIKFAGDVYNALVYARHLFTNTTSSLLSAIGNDEFSQLFVNEAKQYGIDCRYLIRSNNRCLGLYSITVDADGERSFNYWRAGSAASTFFDGNIPNCKEVNDDESASKVFLFSGISLGILKEDKLEGCFEYILQYKAHGYSIAFDPNFRNMLWQSKEYARKCFERAYEVADIVLAGLDDHQELWGHCSAEDMLAYFNQFPNKEIIIKANTSGTFAVYNKNQYHCPFVPAPKQVDTTAAGDAFAGVYLAARLNSYEPDSAMRLANKVAGFVVQHRGAIVPLDSLDNYLSRD